MLSSRRGDGPLIPSLCCFNVGHNLETKQQERYSSWTVSFLSRKIWGLSLHTAPEQSLQERGGAQQGVLEEVIPQLSCKGRAVGMHTHPARDRTSKGLELRIRSQEAGVAGGGGAVCTHTERGFLAAPPSCACSVASVMSDSLRPHDCSPPGSSVLGILQARIWERLLCSSPGDLPNPGMESLMPPASVKVK